MTTDKNNTGNKGRTMLLPWLTQLVNMQEQEELQQEEDQHESICLHCMLADGLAAGREPLARLGGCNYWAMRLLFGNDQNRRTKGT